MRSAMMMLALLVGLSLVCSVPAAAQAPKDYITVGKAKLRLGMSKAEVSKALEGRTIVGQDGDTWLIDPGDPVAVGVQFTNGRVDMATKGWPIQQGDVAGAIFGLVNSLQREAGPVLSCVVLTDTVTEPGRTTQRVGIRCGPKTLTIMRVDRDGRISQDVGEVLGEHWSQ